MLVKVIITAYVVSSIIVTAASQTLMSSDQVLTLAGQCHIFYLPSLFPKKVCTSR